MPSLFVKQKLKLAFILKTKKTLCTNLYTQATHLYSFAVNDQQDKTVFNSLDTNPISVFWKLISLFLILNAGKWFEGRGVPPESTVGKEWKFVTPDCTGELSRTCSSLICTLMDCIRRSTLWIRRWTLFQGNHQCTTGMCVTVRLFHKNSEFSNLVTHLHIPAVCHHTSNRWYQPKEAVWKCLRDES